jgi:hypothetical protein
MTADNASDAPVTYPKSRLGYWDPVVPLGGGRWRGQPVVRRTPKGWAVEQMEWWQTQRMGKVGFRAVYCWHPAQESAQRCADRLVPASNDRGANE